MSSCVQEGKNVIEISAEAKKRAEELIRAKGSSHGPGQNAAWAALEELVQRVGNAAHLADAIAAEHGFAQGQNLLAEFRLPREVPRDPLVEAIKAVNPLNIGYPHEFVAEGIRTWLAEQGLEFVPTNAQVEVGVDVEMTVSLPGGQRRCVHKDGCRSRRECNGAGVCEDQPAASDPDKGGAPPIEIDLRPYGWAPGPFMVQCLECPGQERHLATKGSFRCKRHALFAREQDAIAKYSARWRNVSAVASTAKPSEAERIVALINDLRSDTAASVTILCDNDDPRGPEDAVAVEVAAAWTGWLERRFYGPSVLACLERAVAARDELAGKGEAA